jgi:hypothetical protein
LNPDIFGKPRICPGQQRAVGTAAVNRNIKPVGFIIFQGMKISLETQYRTGEIAQINFPIDRSILVILDPELVATPVRDDTIGDTPNLNVAARWIVWG